MERAKKRFRPRSHSSNTNSNLPSFSRCSTGLTFSSIFAVLYCYYIACSKEQSVPAGKLMLHSKGIARNLHPISKTPEGSQNAEPVDGFFVEVGNTLKYTLMQSWVCDVVAHPLPSALPTLCREDDILLIATGPTESKLSNKVCHLRPNVPPNDDALFVASTILAHSFPK